MKSRTHKAPFWAVAARLVGLAVAIAGLLLVLVVMLGGSSQPAAAAPDPNVSGPLRNVAQALSDEPDPNPANSDDGAISMVNATTDISVTKRDLTDPVPANQHLQYQLVVTNAGPSDAPGVVLLDKLDDRVSFDSASPGCTYDGSPTNGWVGCIVGDLPVGSSASYWITVTVANAPHGTILTNVVTATTTITDINPTNNSDIEETTVVSTVVDLQVTKSASGLLIDPFNEYHVVYSIIVTNTGLLTATGVVVTDVLPVHTSYTGTAWTCSAGLCDRALGDLGPLQTTIVTLPVTLDRSALGCPMVLTNTVSVTDDGSYGTDLDPTNNTFTLTSTYQCLPDLRVVLNDGVVLLSFASGTPLSEQMNQLQGIDQLPCVNPGERITYAISYNNSGSFTATQVVLTMTIPASTTYTGSGWLCGSDVCTRSLGTLEPGQGGSANFGVRVDGIPPDWTIEAEARIGAAEGDLFPPDNVSREETLVCGGGPTPAGFVFLPLILRDYPPSPAPTPTPTPSPAPGTGHVSAVAVNPDTNRVYVASAAYDTVWVVDPTGGGSVIASVPVGDHPVGLAVVTSTNKIYAANLYGWTVTAIRGSDNSPIADLYAGVQPCRVAADSGDARVYVVNHLEPDNGALAINSHTDSQEYFYTRLHAAQGRYGLDVDPAQEKLFIAARDAGLIAIQDAYQPNQDPLVFKLDPPRVPYVVAFNPTTGHLFVTAADDHKVVILAPYSIELTSTASYVQEGQRIYVLDQTNAGWIKEIDVGWGAEEGIAVNPKTGQVFVTNAHDDTVSIIQDDADPAQIQLIKDLPVGDYPQGVAVDVKANLIYVGNANSQDLTVIDGASLTVSNTIPIP